tara:strand:+ start:5687 stop:7426 length:1740 start_codon:yes stop_codon:yes gene_type:complete
MSVSFWKAEGKIPIEQTSNAVGALNGLNFSGGQQVRIKVPPSTKFIKPDECYINADFLIEREASPNFETILQLDPVLAGQSLIKDISIYSSAERGSVLLEQITNYNSMVSVMRDYDTNDSDKNRRALTEGGTVWKPDTRGTLGTTVSDCADCTPTNPYFTAPFNSSGNKVSKTTTFQTVKLCIPLETGIFRSSTVWANMFTGLEIVITLEEASKVLRPLDSVMRNRRLRLNPRFHSLNGSSAPNDWANAGVADRFYIEHANSNITPAQCGFIVGEKINFVSPDNASTAGFASENVISQVNASASANGGAGLVEIVLTGNASNTGGSVIKNSWFMFSESISSDSAFKPTYKLENVELVVQEVDMGQNYVNDVLGSMKEKGVIVNDILSVQNYKASLSSDDLVANIRLPLTNARAKSIVCVPTDASVYTPSAQMSATGTYDIGAESNIDTTLNAIDQMRGCSDHLTNFQWVYDGRLQPNRPVRCSKTSSKTSIDAQPLIETNKALIQSDISVKSLSQFNRNFIICRALAINKGVYDTRNKDFNLQLNYQETTAPTKNKLLNNFVFHLRRISISGDNIVVEV